MFRPHRTITTALGPLSAVFRASPYVAFVVGVLLSAGLLSPAAAQVAGPPVESSILPNGMVVVTERRPESLAAGMAVALRAGSRFEDEATDSAAHLLEHMYFQGTPSRPSTYELSRPIVEVGGDLATWAGWELLRLQAEVPAGALDVAIDVLSDMLLNSTFDPDKYDKERRIVLQELADIRDTPVELVGEVLRRELFAGQALAHLSSGSEAGVRRLTRADLLAFRDRWVGSDRAVVAVVSPFEHADVVERVGRAFAAFGPAAAPPEPAVEAGRARTGRVDVAAGSEQAHVAVAVPVPGLNSADRHALRVIEASLSGFSGRLTAEIRDRRGLAYRTSAGAALLSDAGMFSVRAGTDPRNAEDVVELLRAELARLREEPLPAAELERAIGLATGGRLVETETAYARAVDLALAWGLGATESLEAYEAAIRAVSAADVQRVARRYFGPERQLIVVVRP